MTTGAAPQITERHRREELLAIAGLAGMVAAVCLVSVIAYVRTGEHHLALLIVALFAAAVTGAGVMKFAARRSSDTGKAVS